MSDEQSIGDQLAAWGKVAILETRGRVTGRSVRSAVGFAQEDDGSVLVAAGSATADWALNLRSDGRCRATIGERSRRYLAVEMDGPQRSAAIARLILKYGTPAEGLGRGPVFRLSPVKGND